MSIIISLLLGLLFDFLTKLIEEWLLNNLLYPSAEQLAMSRADFIAKVKWRFWLGSRRAELAGKAFDLTIKKYSNLPKFYMDRDTSSPNYTITVAMRGLADAL